jgi:phosphatidylglycerophosphate synthase
MTDSYGTKPPPRESFAQTAGRLGAAQKGTVGVPAYLRFVNRRAGGLLAVAAYQAGLSPAHVTAISAVCAAAGIAGLVLFAPSLWLGMAVAAALCLGYAFDSADGQLARLRGGGTLAGEWLDHVVDCAKSLSLHAAVLVAMYRYFDLPHAALLLVPIGFSIVGNTFYFAMMLRDQLLPRSTGRAGPRTGSVARSIVLLPVDYGTLCLSFCLWGATDLFLLVYGLLFAINTIFAAQGLPKAFRLLSSSTARISSGSTSDQ